MTDIPEPPDSPERREPPGPTERITPPPTEPLAPPGQPGAAEPAAAQARPAPPSRRRLPAPEELPAVVAAALVLAVAALVFGALLLASSFDGFDEEWKATIKIIGLSVFGGFDVGVGLATNALFAAGMLVLALMLVGRDVPPRREGLVSLVSVGALAISAWLAFFTTLGVVVDLTELGDDFVAAFGVLLSDLATLLVLLLTGFWGYQVYRGPRPR